MLSKIKQKKQEGFTIIEVLIVLAIAGLIMLIVFLAVPALQRNSRNTQRTNDVANILGAVNEYMNNNNGALPPNASTVGGAGSTTATIGSSGNSVEVTLGYYTADRISIATGAATGNDDEEQMRILKGASCNGSNAVAGPTRGVVALYTLENNARQCRES